MPLRTDPTPLKLPPPEIQARNPLDTSSEVTYKKRNYGDDTGEANPEIGPDPDRGADTEAAPAQVLVLALNYSPPPPPPPSLSP